MLKRFSLLVAALVVASGMMSFTSAADQTTRVFFLGGHNPAQMVRIATTPATEAPYALTGTENASPSLRLEAIQTGSRVVGYRLISK